MTKKELERRLRNVEERLTWLEEPPEEDDKFTYVRPTPTWYIPAQHDGDWYYDTYQIYSSVDKPSFSI